MMNAMVARKIVQSSDDLFVSPGGIIPIKVGEEQQFTANTDVEWEIESADAGRTLNEGTAIDEDGLLTIAHGELVRFITVTATSKEDSDKNATATVTPWNIGRIRGNAQPDIFDALEILKFIVGMSSDISHGGRADAAMKAATIVPAPSGGTRGDPNIFDALEVLKYIVGMDNHIGNKFEGQPPTITTASLPNGYGDGTAYNFQLRANGEQPIKWELAGGSLPTGFSLAENGTISGTTGECSTEFKFTVKATNSKGFATRELSIYIDCGDH
jgi:hypothetical protein